MFKQGKYGRVYRLTDGGRTVVLVHHPDGNSLLTVREGAVILHMTIEPEFAPDVVAMFG